MIEKLLDILFFCVGMVIVIVMIGLLWSLIIWTGMFIFIASGALFVIMAIIKFVSFLRD